MIVSLSTLSVISYPFSLITYPYQFHGFCNRNLLSFCLLQFLKVIYYFY